MAKILITPLGVGQPDENRTYKKISYKMNDSDHQYTTSFIAAALSEYLKVDKIFMVGTDKSMWEEVFHYFGQMVNNSEDLEETYLELIDKIGVKNQPSTLKEKDLSFVNDTMDRYLKKLNPSAQGGSVCKLIKPGISEQELQENFTIFMEISKIIQKGDEIYLDITHSFRSIPLFMYLMIDFIQNLRKEEHIQLSGVYYGMLEARQDGYAPIVDLKPLFDITRWTRGIYDFINYGNVDYMVELVENLILKEDLKNISNLTNLNHIKILRSKVDQFREKINEDNGEWSQTLPIFPFIKPYLEKFLNYFQGASSDAKFQFQLAKWFFDHKRYSNGYLCLTESMVTSLTYEYSKVEKNIKVSNRKDRNTIQKLFSLLPTLTTDQYYHELSDLYKEVSKIRHNIAHAGFLSKDNSEEVIDSIPRYISKTEKLFFLSHQNKRLEKIPEIIPFSTISRK